MSPASAAVATLRFATLRPRTPRRVLALLVPVPVRSCPPSGGTFLSAYELPPPPFFGRGQPLEREQRSRGFPRRFPRNFETKFYKTNLRFFLSTFPRGFLPKSKEIFFCEKKIYTRKRGFLAPVFVVVITTNTAHFPNRKKSFFLLV